MIAGSAFSQAELVGRDTTIVTLSRGNFTSVFHKGSTISLSVGLFGRLNLGYSEISWSRYYLERQAPVWEWDWVTHVRVKGREHGSRSGYVEYLPLKRISERFSLIAGVSAHGGTDAGSGLGSYFGFALSAYSNYRVNRWCTVNLNFGQAMIAPETRNSTFMQTNGGAGISLRTSQGIMVSSMVEEIGGTGRYGVTTISFGLSYLMPRL